MINLLPKLRKAFPFLHERAVTEDDLLGFCADRGIKVVFDRDVSTGMWVRFMGDDYIFLNSRLRGWRLLYVFTHEIGHFLFHAPTQVSSKVEFFGIHSKEKNHFEAEAVAAFLLLPIAELEEALVSGAFKRNRDLAQMIAFRLDLFGRYQT